MIIEFDTKLADKLSEISICQLVFLTLVLNDNQKNHQDVHSLLSRVREHEIQELINNDLISVVKTENKSIYTPTEKLKALIKVDKDFFDELYKAFPIYVLRPDGTKGFLRANVNKCRDQYKKITGKSRATHEHIMNCLKYEVDNKLCTGKLGYMKTMWKWLTNHEWEAIEEQMQFNTIPNNKENEGNEFF